MRPNGMIIDAFHALEEQRNVIKQEGLNLANLSEMNHRQSDVENGISAMGLAPIDALRLHELVQPYWEPYLPFPSDYACAASAASNYTGSTLGMQPLDDYTRLMTCPHAGPIKYGDMDEARRFRQLCLGSPTLGLNQHGKGPADGAIDRDRLQIFADGEWHHATEAACDIVELLTRQPGAWVQGAKLGVSRPDKIIGKLPDPVRRHITSSKSNGYRWV